MAMQVVYAFQLHLIEKKVMKGRTKNYGHGTEGRLALEQYSFVNQMQ